MKAERYNDLTQSTRPHGKRIMNTPPSILNYSQQAGIPFNVYTTEQIVTIVRTWVEQL